MDYSRTNNPESSETRPKVTEDFEDIPTFSVDSQESCDDSLKALERHRSSNKVPRSALDLCTKRVFIKKKKKNSLT